MISDAVAAHVLSSRQKRSIFAGLVGVLAVLAALSSGWQAVREYRTVVGLPPSPSHARNVVLIVWDTVRAYNLSLYGYSRETTPKSDTLGTEGRHIQARAGTRPMDVPLALLVLHRRVAVPAQFAVEVHSGRLWPHAESANTRAHAAIRPPASRRNTSCCSYESGLNRGFVHYDDYALTPRSPLSQYARLPETDRQRIL